MDSNPLDTQGKMILEICKSFKTRILNGRTPGDRWGAPTRFPLNRIEQPSLIDYGLCSSNLIPYVRSFFVLPYNDISDHCCISVCLEVINRGDDHSTPISNPKTSPGIPKFDPTFIEKYRDNLKTDTTFQQLSENITARTILDNNCNPGQEEIDAWLEKFNDLVILNAKKSFPPSRLCRKPIPNKKIAPRPANWYSKECQKAKNKYKRLVNKINRNPFDRHLQELLISARKEYKRTCRKAESKFREKMLLNLLKSNDPKKFWKLIKEMKGWGRDIEDPSHSIPPEKWEQHFRTLLNSAKYKSFKVPENLQSIPEMDGKISEQELQEALGKAKAGKACGPDGILIEFIKHATDNVLKTLLNLMNTIFYHAIYPTQWTINFLKAIYKKGSKEDPDNYRGLAIGPAIGKLYSIILLQRLEHLVEDRKILSRNQIGFRKGYRTADHIFLLKTLITKMTQQKNKKLYAAFIDFKKAYDTVNRATLLERLSSIGVGYKMLLNLQAMYNKTEYMIKLKANTLEPIPSNLGLKQGCPLSPLLFNIYINDFAAYLDDRGDTDITLQGTKITHFLYADDLVILSDSRQGLQNKLDNLGKFAKDKDLTVNNTKSKIMIFNKRGRLIKETFEINDKKVDIVKSFTYLGIDITINGSFAPAIKELASKAKKAMIPLYKTIMQFQIPFTNSLKLFHTFIEPILLYNAENWSILTDKQIEKCRLNQPSLYEIAIKSPTTTTQLKFCKFILGLNRQCPSMAVLGESAEIPLTLKALLTMLKFWNRIRHMDDETLVKKAYQENISMNTSWCKTIQILNTSQNLHARQYTPTEFPGIAKQNIRKNFIKHWESRIKDQNVEKKLGFYAKAKHNFQVEHYLNLPSFKDRRRLSKFLCSDHSLEIEKGRHKNTPRNERLCTTCDLVKIEDEEHFLAECPAYSAIRESLMGLHTTQLNPMKAEHFLLTGDHLNLTKYIKQALKLRESIETERMGRYYVTQTSLSGMQISLHRFTTLPETSPPPLSSHNRLQITDMTNNGLKFKISRRVGRVAPYKKKGC